MLLKASEGGGFCDVTIRPSRSPTATARPSFLSSAVASAVLASSFLPFFALFVTLASFPSPPCILLFYFPSASSSDCTRFLTFNLPLIFLTRVTLIPIAMPCSRASAALKDELAAAGIKPTTTSLTLQCLSRGEADHMALPLHAHTPRLSHD